MPHPLAIPAVAAATASLAYLNARLQFGYDMELLNALVRSYSQSRLAEYHDRTNLFYLLEAHAGASSTKDRPFIVFGGRSYTFSETYGLVLRYGNYFKHTLGVTAGEVVAVDMVNSDGFVLVWLGLWAIGATPAFINYNLTKGPLVHSVRVSTARLLVVDADVYEARFGPDERAAFAAPDFRSGNGSLELITYDAASEAALRTAPPVREPDHVRAGTTSTDPAILIYTSGTTGLPKPAIMSWHKLHLGGGFVARWMGLRTDDRVYSCMPLYHSTAAVLGLTACLITSTTYIIGKKFSARSFWREVRDADATVVQYVGETMRYLLATPPDRDPVTGADLDRANRVRLIYGNGLRPDVWNRVKDRFGIETVCEFYASTEGNSGAWNKSSNDWSAGAVGRNGAIGNLALYRSVAVVRIDFDTEQPWRDPVTGLCARVLRGEPGELLYRLPADNPRLAFQGYLGNKAATEAKIMRNVLSHGDAWFRTGDSMRWDSEGRWYFSDRLGDTFRWRSENVSTSEVQQVMGSHPAVHETNVYGIRVPHAEGRAGCAAIVFEKQLSAASGDSSASSEPAPLLAPDPDTLASLAKHGIANLPRYAVPLFLRVTRFMEATGNNKQQKVLLRDQGVDADRLARDRVDDRIYWLQGDTYVPFGEDDWRRLQRGEVRL